MGEEFQAGICSDNWWSSSRSMLVAVGGLSPCSVGIGDFGWPPSDDHFSSDIKPKSSSDDNSSMANFQDHSSTFQMMGFSLSSSSPTSDWNQTDHDHLLCGGGRGESHFNYSQTNFSSGIGNDYCDVNSINSSSSVDSTTLYGYPSKLQLPSLYDDPANPLFNDLTLSSTPNFPSNYLKPSIPKQPQPLSSGLHFINNTPFWNASAAASTDVSQGIVSSSLQTQVLASILGERDHPKCQNSALALKVVNSANSEDGQEPIKKGDHKNSTAEAPVFKRPRIETPSPLPTFKVRKEKLGDRVTALQQLVSPFGKTDTASVLHEAIEYIKFLHDQVSVLSTPYMKNKNGTPVQHQQACEKGEGGRAKEDLRSRGLCLVPISSTFPVTNATTPDFWTPTFGGTFR